jgi:hypothetical protein
MSAPWSLPMRPLLPLLALGALLIAAPAQAEVLKIGDAPPTVVQLGERPERGMNADVVAARFGEPMARNPAVGEPPISSWEYPGYTVYFEGPFVLHSVEHSATP